MSLPHQKMREAVFQLLYSLDMSKSTESDVIKLIMEQLSITKKAVNLAYKRAELVQAKQDEIDNMIEDSSVAYDFNRITGVERNVLRLGLYELLFDNEIPPKVAISEAIRLTRKFSTPQSGNFVNAIMDNIWKKSLGEEVNESALNESIQDLEESEEISSKAHESEDTEE